MTVARKQFGSQLWDSLEQKLPFNIGSIMNPELNDLSSGSFSTVMLKKSAATRPLFLLFFGWEFSPFKYLVKNHYLWYQYWIG